MNYETIKIYVWPDNSWESSEEIDDMDFYLSTSGKSDDYAEYEVDIELDAKDITELIELGAIEKLIPKILYRYDGCANFDGFCCTEYIILRETECGWWIRYDNNRLVAHYNNNKAEKWVSKTGKKRFCYPTKLEALNSLYHRQNMRIKILNSQLTISHNLRKTCINLIRKMENENGN